MPTCQERSSEFSTVLNRALMDSKLSGAEANRLASLFRIIRHNCPNLEGQMGTAIFNGVQAGTITSAQAAQIVGPALISAAQGNVTAAVNQAGNIPVIGGIVDFLKLLANVNTWIRIAMVLGGAYLFLFGLKMLAKQLEIPNLPGSGIVKALA